jgi:two-component system, NtrC family, response regulator AlgB
MRILIVDDEPNIRKSLRIALESMKNTVEEAVSLADAAKRIERSPFDAAFIDLRLRDESGLDLLESLARLSPRLAVVIITAFASIDSAVDAMRRGAFDYLPKPFTPAQIRAVLERFERVRGLRSQIADLQEQIGVEVPEVSLGTSDSQVRLVLEQGQQVAATDAVVLIRGESGTGKGVFARAIHAASRRAQGPFVTVSCPSLNADLLESALFGHVRGESRRGRGRDTVS